MKTGLMLLVFFALCSAGTATVKASPTNDIRYTGANPARDYSHARTVKLVFDLNSISPTPTDVNPGLIAIGDLMRQYGSFEKDRPCLVVVVVLHGKTTELALDAVSSARPPSGAANGSVDVMRNLAGKGVHFIVSRQALAKRKIDEKEVQSFIHFGPTAEIIFLDLEASGYIFDGSTSLGGD